MTITIDKNAGFCPGVRRAIKTADKYLEEESFACLGSLLHNEKEMERLGDRGLKIVRRSDLKNLSGKKVLLRSHGEPPETYDLVGKYGVKAIDATCGVVRKLQHRVAKAAVKMEKKNGQVVIFGKIGHPEVAGLLGNSKGLGIVVSSLQDLGKVDMMRAVRLFSQTTMDNNVYQLFVDSLREQMRQKGNHDFESYDTICKNVLKRVPALRSFAEQHEVIIFVSGRESSNGKKLFQECRLVNPDSYFISGAEELQAAWFEGKESIGVSGSASTPQWLMEKVAGEIEKMI